MEGIGIKYLKELENYIGFQCATIKSYTSEQVGFTEFINRMYACILGNSTEQSDSICSCELGTGGWTQSEERYPKVRFLVPFIHDSMQIVTIVDNTNSSTNGAFFLSAYSTGVWVTVLGLTVMFIVLKLVDARFEPISQVQSHSFSSFWQQLGFRLKQRLKRLRSAVRSVGK